MQWKAVIEATHQSWCVRPTRHVERFVTARHNLFCPHVKAMGAHRALCAHCAKSWLFSTTGSHGSQGPEFCTLQPLLVHQGFFVLV